MTTIIIRKWSYCAHTSVTVYVGSGTVAMVTVEHKKETITTRKQFIIILWPYILQLATSPLAPPTHSILNTHRNLPFSLCPLTSYSSSSPSSRRSRASFSENSPTLIGGWSGSAKTNNNIHRSPLHHHQQQKQQQQKTN